MWFCLLLSWHHISFQFFSVRHRFSKHCISEVCSQHALCAYMWIIQAREQCSSTWPVSWNIPQCDPWEASQPTVSPLPPPCSDPEECPCGPVDQPARPANFGFLIWNKNLARHLTMGLCYSFLSSTFSWEECVVSSVVVFHGDMFFRCRIVFQSLCNEATTWQPPTAIFETSCVLISYCLL